MHILEHKNVLLLVPYPFTSQKQNIPESPDRHNITEILFKVVLNTITIYTACTYLYFRFQSCNTSNSDFIHRCHCRKIDLFSLYMEFWVKLKLFSFWYDLWLTFLEWHLDSQMYIWLYSADLLSQLIFLHLVYTTSIFTCEETIQNNKMDLYLCDANFLWFHDYLLVCGY